MRLLTIYRYSDGVLRMTTRQRLEPIMSDVEDVWQTVLYMSYATVQKHLAFDKML